MLIRFISQLLKSNQMQFKTQDNILILKQVEQLIYLDKIEEALKEVENLQNKMDLDDEEKIQFEILRSLIFDKLGQYTTSLEIAEHAYKECQRLENHFLVIDAIISLANAIFSLDDLSKCLDVINKGEKLLIAINKGHEKENIRRLASLKFLKGKIYWKKGELNQALELVQENFTIKQELENLYETADYHNLLGIIYTNKGEFDRALNHLQNSLTMFEELGLKSSIVKSLNNIGQIYWRKGDLKQALDNYKMSLERSEELGNKQFIASISLNIGYLFWNMGELDNALDFYWKSLDISKEIDHKSAMAACLNGIGIILQFKGELDQALEFYQKSLVLEEKLGKKLDVALCLNNIGEIHHIKGFFEEASDYYRKSLGLFEEVGNNYHMCLALFNLVLVAVDRGSIGQTQPYLQKLQEIDNKEKNKHISQKFRLAKAIVLKESKRVVNIAEAQKIFHQVAHEEMISLEHNVTANLNLCELLLHELRTTGNEEVLSELNEVVSRLRYVAEDQNSSIWLAKTYWLQSKIALIEFDLKQSQYLLTQAELIAYEKGLTKLLAKISSERDILLSQFNKWEKVLEQKPSVSEIIELTQIEKMVDRMIQKKLDTADEEIMHYAVESKRLVEMWERE